MSDEQQIELSQVLVADDDPAILLLVKTILEKEGYTVICARDGKEAFRVLYSGKPLVAAIFDVTMPQIHGTDLVKHMQSEKRLMGIPVIIITAEQNSRLLPKSYNSGAVAFIPKPFKSSQLITLLNMFVNKN